MVIKEGKGFRVNGVFRWRASAGAGKEGWGRGGDGPKPRGSPWAPPRQGGREGRGRARDDGSE